MITDCDARLHISTFPSFSFSQLSRQTAMARTTSIAVTDDFSAENGARPDNNAHGMPQHCQKVCSLTEEDDVAEFPAGGAHDGRVVVARVDEEDADVGEDPADGEGDGADRPLGRRAQVLRFQSVRNRAWVSNPFGREQAPRNPMIQPSKIYGMGGGGHWGPIVTVTVVARSKYLQLQLYE